MSATSQHSQSTTKRYIDWTEEKRKLLANLASKYEAYKKTEKSFEKKWSDVLADCLKSKECIDWVANPPKWDALETAFKRQMAEILKKHGISEEGANLSGYEDEPDAYVKLMHDMAEDRAVCEQVKKAQKEKEEKKKMAIFTHETEQIEKQNQLGDTSAVEIKHEGTPEGQLLSTISRNTITSKKRQNPFGFLEDLMKDDDRIIDLSVDERTEELEYIRKKHVMELEHADRKLTFEIENESKRLTMDERRLSLEEKKIALEELRLKAESQQQNAMLTLMNVLIKKIDN